jgi:hypothetical protein
MDGDIPNDPQVMTNIAIEAMAQLKVRWFTHLKKWWIFPVRYIGKHTKDHDHLPEGIPNDIGLFYPQTTHQRIIC